MSLVPGNLISISNAKNVETRESVLAKRARENVSYFDFVTNHFSSVNSSLTISLPPKSRKRNLIFPPSLFGVINLSRNFIPF
jgi:hypothetical protein